MKKLLFITLFAVLALVISLIVFFSRSPVLIVADQALIPFYGKSRMEKETRRAAFSLFRPVKNIFIADNAGDDIVQYAVTEVSSRPYCVIFYHRFTKAARIYRENNPEIPVVILEGRSGKEQSMTEDYFFYKTDVQSDFYKAGLAAGAIENNKNGKIIVFLEPENEIKAKEAFLSALNTLGRPFDPLFFTSFNDYYDISDISCVVISGIGVEFIDTNPGVPVILFTWLDPDFLPSNVVLVFNDSPWVQSLQAARMVSASLTKGQILSKIIVSNRKNIHKETLRKILKMG
jgi:hypothetical protein